MDGLQASRLIKSDETLLHQPAIVIVTAFGREEVREEAEHLHLDGFLFKPVTKSMLVDALVNIYAATVEETAIADIESAKDARRLQGLRILLAEDNEINQQIAIELLEGVGATVDVANNGREAVEKLFQASWRDSLRSCIDGSSNAGNGWSSSDYKNPFRFTLRTSADHRNDSSCNNGRTPALSRNRYE